MSESPPASSNKHYPFPCIIFDTETTGLPPWHRNPTRIADWNGCRLVQLAWMVIDPAGAEASHYEATVTPDGFVVPAAAAAIHGITTEKALAEGRPLSEVLTAFETVLDRYPNAPLVAHNIEFDMGVITTEAMRLEMSHLLALLGRPQKHCTMLTGTKKGKKWPKLVDLYREYFGNEPEGTAHNALWDVRTCAAIYKRQATAA